MWLAIDFPDISPEIFAIDLGGFHFALRWYAMGYIVGILIGWWIIAPRHRPPQRCWRDGAPMTRAQLEELVTWMVVGIILGGRLGFVLFYQPGYYLQNPADIVKVWQGGMAFHGGFLGVVIAVWLFSRRQRLPTATLADLLAIATPPGARPRADRQFHQRRALGPADRRALGRDLSRRGGAGLRHRRRPLRPPPLAALRGGAGRRAAGRAAAAARLPLAAG